MSEPKRARRTSRHFSGNAAIDPELSETITAMIESLHAFPNPELVIGNGWASMLAVGLLATKKPEMGNPANVLWLTNSGSRALAPLPFLENGTAVGVWFELARRLGISIDEPQSGHFLREFRHRSFSRAPWHKAPTREARIETRNEYVWGPEYRIAPIFESRFETSLAELEEAIRAKIAALPNVKILSGVPVVGFESLSDSSTLNAVRLASGASIAFRRAIWADRWIGLSAIEGLPKSAAFTRNREPMGILQAVFTHAEAMVDSSFQEAFFGSIHKDAGEEFNRSVWGSFFESGKKSVWTIFLSEEEGADNHSIGKKYRRLRQALDKMFTGSEWIPSGAKDFSATIVKEQLLFQEDSIFARGEAPADVPVLSGVQFITDAFGPSVAAESVAKALGKEFDLDVERFAALEGAALGQSGSETHHENIDSNPSLSV